MRRNDMSILKGLGIIFIVLGHAGVPFWQFLYLFHVPLFFFVSGFFYNRKYESSPGFFIIKKIKVLYFPFVKFCLFFLLLHNSFYKVGLINTFYNKSLFIKNFIKIILFQNTETLIGAIWFVSELFIVTVSYLLLRKIVKNKYIFNIIIFLLYISSFIIPVTNIFFKVISITGVCITSYHIGFIYKSFEKKVEIKSYMFLLFSAITITSSFFFYIDIASTNYTNPILFLFCSLSGIFMFLYVSAFISRYTFLSKLLIYIGDNSFNIMALHLLSFKVINYILFIISGDETLLLIFPAIKGYYWVFYLIVGVSLPLIYTYVSKKIIGFLKNKITFYN